MSDQTPGLSNLGAVDGRNLINVPGGGGGINTINGDPTLAQTLVSPGPPLVITDGGGGLHTFTVTAMTGLTDETVSGITTDPVVQLRAFVDGLIVPATFSIAFAGSSVMNFNITTFLSGHGGLVSDPGGAAATDYLGADNTFRPIPAGGGITTINGDATAAQAITGSDGIGVSNSGGGGHTIFGVLFAPGTKGVVDDPGAAAATDYLGADNTFRPLPLSAVQIAQTVSAGDTIPDNTPTTICSVTVPATGFYQVSANVKFATLPAGFAEYRIEILDDFAVTVLAEQSLQTAPAVGAFTASLNCSVACQAVVGAGHTFSIGVTQISGGALLTTADLLTSLTMLFLSA